MPAFLAPRVRAYIDAVVQACALNEQPLTSLILFGSAAIGGFSETVSDVDLILVLPDGTAPEARAALSNIVTGVEILHGFREARLSPPRPLETFVEKITASVRSFFVCTRGDMISGDVARLLSLPPAQAFFVDRGVIPSIVLSGITVWGEDLLPLVPILPIRRADVFKAFFGFWSQTLLSLAVFPLLPSATKYAVGSLKRSLHNCFFCYHCRRASLEEEVDFFQRRLGPTGTLTELMALRGQYRRSLRFVIGCLPTLVRLHLHTARDNRFPRTAELQDRDAPAQTARQA